jgi:hypothetical protein
MKIFLEGLYSCSTWQNVLIPMLKIDYFNPTFSTPGTSAKKKELREKENCDFCLYVITPTIIGIYSPTRIGLYTIAKIVDDSNKRPDKTIICLLKKYEGFEFLDSQWESLGEVAKIIERNGSKVFYSLKSVADYVNSWERRYYSME